MYRKREIEEKKRKVRAARLIQRQIRLRHRKKLHAKNVLFKLMMLQQEKMKEKRASLTIQRHARKKLDINLKGRRASTIQSHFRANLIIKKRKEYVCKIFVPVTGIALILFATIAYISKEMLSQKVRRLKNLFIPLYALRQFQHGQCQLIQNFYRAHLRLVLLKKLRAIKMTKESYRRHAENDFVMKQMKIMLPVLKKRVSKNKSYNKKLKGELMVTYSTKSTEPDNQRLEERSYTATILFCICCFARVKFRKKRLEEEVQNEEAILRFEFREIKPPHNWISRYVYK